jgi:hypothetical protein
MSITNTNPHTPERSLKWQGRNQAAVHEMIAALMEKHGKRIQDLMESNPSLSLDQVVLTVAVQATMRSVKPGKHQEVVLNTQLSHTGALAGSTRRMQ